SRERIETGVTTDSPLPNPSEFPIEPVVFLLHMVDPERFPFPVEVRCTQVQHGLSPFRKPTHPRPLQAVLHQMPACSFNHPTADRVARRQVLVVTHPAAVPSEVADHLPHGLAAWAPEFPLRHRLTQATDDVAHSPVQEHPQPVLHPLLGFGLLRTLL